MRCISKRYIKGLEKMTNKKKQPLRLLAVLMVVLAVSVGCKKEANVTMNGLSIENNIAYNYVLSTSLSTAKGFAADLGVVGAGDSNTEEGVLTASAALLIDITDGDTVYQKNAHMKLYPASTTKVLTGLVALENGDLSEIAKIDESIYFNEDNVWICDYRIGDTITLEQALYGAIVNSGNDAAAIVATTVAGSISAFADMMNEKAYEIGATNSHFVNPHGLTNEEHYTTAYDLYLIFNEAIKNEEFLKMSSTVKYTTSFTRRTYTITPTWTNGNKMLNGSVTPPNGMKVICGKTGYTQAAGYCLVLLSESPTDGHRFISVVLNAPSRDSLYNQMSYLLEKAFAH